MKNNARIILSETKLEENKKKYKSLFEKGNGYIVTSSWEEPELKLSQVEQYEQKDRDFKLNLVRYEIGARAAEEGFDNVPTVGFFTDVAYMMTLGYECPMQYQGDLVISRYKYANAEQAKAFEYIPDVYKKGLYKIALERIEEFQELYPHIPISVPDTQSPIDIITEFMPADLAIMLLFDAPEEAKRILSGITQSIIDVNRKFESTIKNFSGFKAGAYLPYGIHLSDDNAAFLSPTIYEDFATPFVNVLSKEFNGVSFHVCMKFEQNLKKLVATEGFRAFDAMPYYNDPKLILDALGEKKVWNLYDYEWTRPASEKEAPIDFYKRLIDMNEGRNGLRIDTFNKDREKALKLAWEVKNYLIKKY